MSSILYFRQMAPEFNNMSDDAVTAWFASAGVFLSDGIYDVSKLADSKKEMAIALYAAHLVWLQKYPGQGGGHRGVIKSEKDDKLQRDYQPVQNSDTWLGQSSYGLSFLNLFSGGVRRASILTRFGT